MNLQQQFRDEDIVVRDLGSSGGLAWAVDFGAGSDGTVDVVDGTAIVVVGDDQYEFDLAHDAQVFMKNGVLTIEVNE